MPDCGKNHLEPSVRPHVGLPCAPRPPIVRAGGLSQAKREGGLRRDRSEKDDPEESSRPHQIADRGYPQCPGGRANAGYAHCKRACRLWQAVGEDGAPQAGDMLILGRRAT